MLWGALVIAALVALTPVDPAAPAGAVPLGLGVGRGHVACAAVSLALSGAETGSSLAGQSSGGSFWNAVNDANFIARGVTGGILGWFDVTLPFPVFPIYLVSTGFLVVAAVGFASRRVSLTLLAMTAAAITVTVAIGTIRWPYVQGRYLLPLTVGLPIVAGLGLVEALGRVRLPRRLLWLLFPILAFAQVFSFAQALRRYVSGATQDWWFFSSPQWRPAAGNPTVVVVVYAVGRRGPVRLVVPPGAGGDSRRGAHRPLTPRRRTLGGAVPVRGPGLGEDGSWPLVARRSATVTPSPPGPWWSASVWPSRASRRTPTSSSRPGCWDRRSRAACRCCGPSCS